MTGSVMISRVMWHTSASCPMDWTPLSVEGPHEVPSCWTRAYYVSHHRPKINLRIAASLVRHQ
eukprot:scaffold105366_cov41-Attheya_sp.AAC.2